MVTKQGRLQLEISTVWNVINKLQLKRPSEVELEDQVNFLFFKMSDISAGAVFTIFHFRNQLNIYFGQISV